MAEVNTPLWEQMRARAELDKLPSTHEMNITANVLEATSYGFYANPQTATVKQLVGAWAKARLVWSKYTGEPLI